jgi:hypothetical protein
MWMSWWLCCGGCSRKRRSRSRSHQADTRHVQQGIVLLLRLFDAGRFAGSQCAVRSQRPGGEKSAHENRREKCAHKEPPF